MSWVRIWVHLIFSTKYRIPFLKTRQQRFQVFNHIKENADKKGILLDCVNGYSEHAHCLFLLGRNQSVSKVAQLIKGESSRWINQNKITEAYFNWQNEYWALGIGEEKMPFIRNYIHRQEALHKKLTLSEELSLLKMEKRNS